MNSYSIRQTYPPLIVTTDPFSAHSARNYRGNYPQTFLWKSFFEQGALFQVKRAPVDWDPDHTHKISAISPSAIPPSAFPNSSVSNRMIDKDDTLVNFDQPNPEPAAVKAPDELDLKDGDRDAVLASVSLETHTISINKT